MAVSSPESAAEAHGVPGPKGVLPRKGRVASVATQYLLSLEIFCKQRKHMGRLDAAK